MGRRDKKIQKLSDALRAMVDRWEPDCDGQDRVMWENAVEALEFSEVDPGDLALGELLELSRTYQMTPEETEAQRQSWVRGMTARCEHGELDFERCPKCRGWC